MSEAGKNQRRDYVLWLLCAVGATQVGLACVTSLLWPFGRDQGIFAWVGDVILRGGTPLVDAWEQKGTLTSPATDRPPELATLGVLSAPPSNR